MNVRIISGSRGGRKIDAPTGNRTHPMGERVRNAMFNRLTGEIEGAEVLDAFAGTGVIGLEALSRGARHATFIERDRLAQKILTKNITTLGFDDQTTLIRTTVLNWLRSDDRPLFDIIFVDPPYHDPQLSTAFELQGLLKPNGCMVLSHPGKGEALAKTGVVVVDNRSYGNACLTSFRRVE